MKRIVVAAALLSLTLIAVLLAPMVTDAWSASGIRWITQGNIGVENVIDQDEGFYNYDFTSSTAAQNGTSSKCDFPVTMVFTDDGTVENVKAAYWGSASKHATMYNKCMEYYDQAVDSDKGTRSRIWYPPIDTNPAWHIRPYAWGGSYQYNYVLGAYCVGTTHKDDWVFIPYQGTFALWTGYSEDAEHHCVWDIGDRGYTVYYDCFYMFNYEAYRIEQTVGEFHIWQCDGYASRVVIW